MNKYLITLLIVLSGCNGGAGVWGIWEKDHIPKNDREEAGQTVDKVFRALETKDSTFLLSSCSAHFDKQTIVPLINAIQHVPLTSGRQVIGEFLIKNTSKKGTTPLSGTDQYGNNYIYTCPVGELYSYVYLFTIKAANSPDEILIVCALSKENDNWKLLNFYGADYSVNQMAAPQVYQLARKEYGLGKKFSALMYTELANHLMTPSREGFVFKNSKEDLDFTNKIFGEAKSYINPAKGLGSNVEIFKVEPMSFGGKLRPIVYYSTSTNVNDVPNLTSENDKIDLQIESMLPGISEFSDTIIYKATNAATDKNQNMNDYGFVKPSRRAPSKS